MESGPQALESKLYLEGKGSIEMEILCLTSGPEARVSVWDTQKKNHTWIGTPQEFWELVRKGMSKDQRGCRLEDLEVSAYGYTTTIKRLLEFLTNEELVGVFSAIYTSLLAEGKIDPNQEKKKEN